MAFQRCAGSMVNGIVGKKKKKKIKKIKKKRELKKELMKVG